MQKYRVYKGDTDEIVVEGTSSECAKEMGVTRMSAFYDAVSRSRAGNHAKYRIEVVPGETVLQAGYMEAIKAWDDFVTPIRQRFGIPVRHLGEEKK